MKKYLKLIIKLAITITLLAYFYSKIELDAVMVHLSKLQLWPLVLFFVICVGNMCISSYRWKLLLDADGLVLPFRKLFTSHWIAAFFNFFAPSNIGGDAYRIADIAIKSGKTVNTVASVFVDRLSGFIAMSVVGTIFPLFGLESVPQEHWWKLCIPFCFFCCLIVLLFLIKQQKILRWSMRFMPKVIRGRVEKLLDTFLQSTHAYKAKVLWRCVGLSLVFQFFIIVAVWCIGTSMGLKIRFFDYCIFTPLICILESLPTSINGMGMRDAGYIMFFTAVGIESAQTDGPLAALLYVTMTLLYAFTGGLIFLRRTLMQKPSK